MISDIPRSVHPRRPVLTVLCTAAMVAGVAGCKTTGPSVATLARPTAPVVAAAGIPSAAAPGWVTGAAHPAYPAAAFLTGIGARSMVGDEPYAHAQKAADKQGLAAIAEQVEVKVEQTYSDAMRAEVKDIQDQSGKVKKEGLVHTITEILTKTKVELEVRAATRADHYYDRASRTHYSLWAADRAKWASQLVKAITEKRVEVEQYYREAEGTAQAGRVMLAIQQYLRALRGRAALLKDESTLVVVAPTQAQSLLAAHKLSFTSADVAIRIDRAIDGLALMLVSGDGQVATPNRPLPSPIVVKLVHKAAGRTVAVDKAPIRFTPGGGDASHIELQSPVTTDHTGAAKCLVTKTLFAGKPIHTIEAVPDLSDVFPEAKGLLLPKAQVSYRFLTRRTAKIAVKLFESADDKPLPESFVERKVAGALAAAGFQVLDESELAKKLGNASSLRGADAKQIVAAFAGIADIAVVGSISADLRKGTTYNPGNFIFYQGRRNIRAINTHTGEVLATVDQWGQDEKGGGHSANQAKRMALTFMAQTSSKAIADALAAKFK